MSATTSVPPPATRTEDPGRRAWGVGRVITVIAVLGMIVFWIWILSGAPKRANPDRLDDRALVARLQDECRVLKRIDDAAQAAETPTPGERAVVVDRATSTVDQLVDGFDREAPERGDDGVRMRGWIRDWRTYVGDRRDYTQRLRRDRRARFLLDVNRAGDSVDRALKNFADINDMPECDPPGDIG